MSEIDFRKKMSFRRHYGSHRDARTEYDIIKRFESDRGRIINSAAIRRLQQKTQVFPLERNAAVRSRLTHSMEVQQVGRYIAKEIFHALYNRGKLAHYGLTQLQSSVESVVEMACLMHDIGNPPFGHFGEAAINDWFDKRLDTASCGSESQCQDLCTPNFLRLKQGQMELNHLRSKVRRDLAHFEGNAQAIRLVHTLLRLNLTYAQIACVLKYTLPAYATETVPSHSYLTKKPGFYLAEEDFVATLRQELGMDEYARFPLTYIMEAADDISYCIADLDDAVEKDIFSVYQLYDYLKVAWGEGAPGDLFDKVVGSAFNKMIGCPEKRRNDNVFFMTLRVNTVGELVPHAAMRFVANLDAIYHGHFNEALLEGDSSEKRLLGIFKQVALKRVFNHPEVEQLELQGYRVISGLLDIYSPLLAMPMADFRQMVQEESHRGYPIETRLFHKLSSKHRLAYVEATDALCNLPDIQQQIWEYYYRARFIQDYISGMTDNFAYDEYRRLMAAE